MSVWLVIIWAGPLLQHQRRGRKTPKTQPHVSPLHKKT